MVSMSDDRPQPNVIHIKAPIGPDGFTSGDRLDVEVELDGETATIQDRYYTIDYPWVSICMGFLDDSITETNFKVQRHEAGDSQ